MEIRITTKETAMTVALDGRLDTSTAPQLEKELGTRLESTRSLILDFEDLRYISSAGLRVLLGIHKKMDAQQGSMVIRHTNEMIMEVFEVTGFSEILTIENE